MRSILLPSVFLLFLCAAAQGAAPTLISGTLVYSGSTPISVGWDSIPEVADWNADGKKDLIVGAIASDYFGEIFIYLNQGTDAAPSYGAPVKVQSGGSIIKVGTS